MFALFIISPTAYSQCSDFVHSNYDRFEGTTSYSANFQLIRGNTKVELRISRSNSSKIIYIHPWVWNKNLSSPMGYEYVNFANANSILYLAFVDGSIIKLRNFDPIMGVDFFSVGLWTKSFDDKSVNDVKCLSALRTVNVSEIRLTGPYNLDITLTESERKELQKIFNCLGL